MTPTSDSDPKLSAPSWNTPSPRNIYEWLDDVRQRPGMYVREGEQRLRDLENLIHGYDTALRVHHVDESVPEVGPHFSAWLRLRRRWSLSLGWARAIEDHTPKGKDPLDVFFGLLDQYRKLRLRIMCHVILGPHHAPTGKRCVIGMETLLVPPRKIDVVEHTPEPLHVLRLHYAEGRCVQEMLYNRDGEPATTVEDAQRWVEDEFGVQPSEWVREA